MSSVICVQLLIRKYGNNQCKRKCSRYFCSDIYTLTIRICNLFNLGFWKIHVCCSFVSNMYYTTWQRPVINVVSSLQNGSFILKSLRGSAVLGRFLCCSELLLEVYLWVYLRITTELTSFKKFRVQWANRRSLPTFQGTCWTWTRTKTWRFSVR